MLKAQKCGSEDIAGMIMKPELLAVLTRCKPESWMIRFLAKERKRNFEISRIRWEDELCPEYGGW